MYYTLVEKRPKRKDFNGQIIYQVNTIGYYDELKVALEAAQQYIEEAHRLDKRVQVVVVQCEVVTVLK